MSNNYNIPDWLETKVRQRDKLCVYCAVKMRAYPNVKGVPGDKATFEHIDNDARNITEGNIVICCGACNSSKGVKMLATWLKSDYCQKKNITTKTMAPIIRQFLKK